MLGPCLCLAGDTTTTSAAHSLVVGSMSFAVVARWCDVCRDTCCVLGISWKGGKMTIWKVAVTIGMEATTAPARLRRTYVCIAIMVWYKLHPSI
jgi:hypothetical protein